MSSPWDDLIWQALVGFVPRHVFDVDLNAKGIDPEWEKGCRKLVTEAFAHADKICYSLEAQCHELEALEDDGLAGRIRYLAALAVIAGVLDQQGHLRQSRQLSFVRSVHAATESWRPGSTYDLSNAAAALMFGTQERERGDVLGHWIWINLLTGGANTHVKWIASTMRFSNALGRRVWDTVDQIISDLHGMLCEG